MFLLNLTLLYQYIRNISICKIDRQVFFCTQQLSESEGYAAWMACFWLVVNGKITNAAMLLLGDERYDYLMENMPEASRRVYDSKDMVKDYKIFRIPFITLSDRITGNISNADLDLATVYLLDQVQKGKRIPKEAVAHLRKHKHVEGRADNLYLAAPLARSDDDKAKYIKNKGFDNKYYQDLILDYIRKFGKASKQQIRILLADKLPETMTEEQKERKTLYLLTRLKEKGAIVRDADSRKMTNWIIKDDKNG